MTDKPKWTDLFGIDPTYDDTAERAEGTRQERAIRRAVADEIYEAIKKRRDEAHDEHHRGWPLLTEAMVLAREIGSQGGEQ